MSGVDLLKRGWLIKQGGRVKTWKRRYFVLDSSGRLTYFTSDSDAEQGSNKLGVINIKKALYVTPRSKDKDSSTWPPPVPVDACFTIITNDRNYGMYGENEEAGQGWLKALQAVRGGVDHAEITALVNESSTERHDSGASRSNSTEAVRRRYRLTDDIPHKVQTMFAKWHDALLAKSLGAMSSHFECDAFSLTCDMGKLYTQAPRPIRNRLGELIFGDYVDELRHNICKEFGSDPVAKKAFLTATSKRQIDFSIKEGSGGGFADVSAKEGVLYVTVTSDMLGRGVHMTGKTFASSLSVDHSVPVCGGLLDGLPLNDALDVINAKPALAKALEKLGHAVPGKTKAEFECDYRGIHEAARVGSCLQVRSHMGNTVITKVLHQVVEGVVEKLKSAGEDGKARINGDGDTVKVIFRLDSNEKANTTASFTSNGAELLVSCGLEKLYEIVQYDRIPSLNLDSLLEETADSV